MPDPMFVSPLYATADQRKAGLISLNDRMARVTAKVAADKTQPKAVRAANARDNATARRIATQLRAS